ncbi:MAG TPA: hypothetical protein VNX88_08610, partial [Terriglobales bacterium]|nr:hypothetical protein [Terriglobales bacterium]
PWNIIQMPDNVKTLKKSDFDVPECPHPERTFQGAQSQASERTVMAIARACVTEDAGPRSSCANAGEAPSKIGRGKVSMFLDRVDRERAHCAVEIAARFPRARTPSPAAGWFSNVR